MEEFAKNSGKGLLRETFKKVGFYMPKSESSLQHKIEEYQKVVEELQNHVSYLENRSEELIKRLESALHELDILKRKYYFNQEQLNNGRKQNEKLVNALSEAKEQIEALKEEVEKLCQPPNTYGVFRRVNEDKTIDIYLDGRKLKVNVRPGLEINQIKEGQELILNEAYNVIGLSNFDTKGEVVKVKEILDDSRAIVSIRGDEERVAIVSEFLEIAQLKVGDSVLMNSQASYLYEKLPSSDIEEVMLEEVPDVTYDNIGGLAEQIEMLKDGIELPYLYPEIFKKYKLNPPKGILLYGPPGCGKTLIAKAVANSLAKKVESKTGRQIRSYFLNIKGPELLNKYVGETEHKIREIFKKAREEAKKDIPVIIFFDEMDSLFRMRGSGISSDMEITVVAQLLSEIDGLEGLKNVIVIGASNRQDLIDPAVLRPGRLNLKIKINRPERPQAADIFSKYFTADLPLFHNEDAFPGEASPEHVIKTLIDQTVDEMFSEKDDNRFLEVTYAKGDKEIFYFKDFASGAMIENIVARAKKKALKRELANGEKGIMLEDLISGIKEEFKENEDLPNTTNPDDWAKISGRKGEKIVNVRTLLGGSTPKAKNIEDIHAAQYL